MRSSGRILLLLLVVAAVTSLASSAEKKRIHLRRNPVARRRRPVVAAAEQETIAAAESQRRVNVAVQESTVQEEENAVVTKASTARASSRSRSRSRSSSSSSSRSSSSSSTRGRARGRGRGRGSSSSSSVQIAVPKGTDTNNLEGINIRELAAKLAAAASSSPSRSRAPQGIATPSRSSAKPVPSLPVSASDRKIVCYFTNWAQYRPTIGKYLPEHIDPFICTHIIYAFSSMKHNRLTPFEHNDISKDGKIGLYEQVTNLKKVNPKLKVLLAIGGWSFGTKKFKDMSSNRYNRRTFVYSVAAYLREHKFDGLDLDWEYPKGATDKSNFAELCMDLHEDFESEAKETGKPKLLLTAAVPVGPDTIRGGYDVPKLARALDIFNIMAYDFHGKWESKAGHNAPLNAHSTDSQWQKQLSVNASVHMWMRLGAPKHKIVVGMPTYGRSFTLADPANTAVNAPSSGGGTAGVYTKEGGFLAYYELCEMMYAGAQYVWDRDMSVPYLISGNQWVGFDDERSIRNKMDYIKDMGLAGAMVWSMDMDDFAGKACKGAKYPLISAMREELLGISREDKKRDIDWTKIAPVKARPSTASVAPIITKLSTADIIAILKAQGINPDPKTVQKLSQLALSSTSARSSSATSGNAILGTQFDDNLSAPKVFCYVSSWARDRPGRGRFSPADLDPSLCTHVVWAFGTIRQGAILLPSQDQNEKDEESDYRQLLRLRETNPELKLLLALGGWSAGPEPFQEITSSDYKMNNFVYDTVDFIRRKHLDGIDIDWEYPSGSADREAYSSLIREFKLAFVDEAKASKKSRLLLTAALPASAEAIYSGYDVPEISKHLDFLNIMTYDFHGNWDEAVGHNAPLYPLEGASREEKKMSVDAAAREWVKEGAAPEKMLIGMPTYGRTFTLSDEAEYDIGAPVSGGGKPARFTREEGFASYYEVCDFLERDNTTLIWDNEQIVPFAFNGDQWIGFDDERSITAKVDWLRDLGFGGVMVWAADLDDFRGSCGAGPFPLVNTMLDALDGYRVQYTYDGGADFTPGVKANPNEVVCDNGDNEVTFHRDVLDCKQYYLCQGTVRHHMPCPVDLVFNEAESVCDWPVNVEACWAFTQPPPAE